MLNIRDASPASPPPTSSRPIRAAGPAARRADSLTPLPHRGRARRPVNPSIPSDRNDSYHARATSESSLDGTT